MKMSGNTVLITGGASGIGQALVQRFNDLGNIVIVAGKLTGYIVSVGGFLGMGERYVVIDPSSAALTYDTGAKKWKASVNASKDALKAAPEFKDDGKFKR